MLHGCNFSDFLDFRTSHFLPYREVSIKNGDVYTFFYDIDHKLSCCCVFSEICSVYNIC